MPIVKKIHHLERTQHAFLDHSKTLVFSDVIKIEILVKYSRHSYLFLTRQKNHIEPPRLKCGSRKYPYPTSEGISLRTPLTPWIFHIFKELITPPPLQNFHKVRQRPPNPSGKFSFTKNNYQSKERRRLRLCNGFHLILLSGLQIEHSKLHTKAI